MLRVTSVCVLLAALAVVLDGLVPMPGALGSSPHWIDLAAVACIALGVDWRALLSGQDEGTPVDGLLLGALAIAAVQAWAGPRNVASNAWLAQLVAGSGIFFGLTRAMRRSPGAIEAVWRALAALAVVLGLYAAWGAAGGLAGLARQEAQVDAAWVGHHTLVKALAFLTIALAGRALEHRAAPLWRLATAIGAIGTGLHLACGGLGLGARALGRLDDPVFFSTLSLALLLAVGIARAAWEVGRTRPNEAARWRAIAIATGVIAVGGALGEASGGEGVRMVVALGAVAAMSARAVPALAVVPQAPRVREQDEAQDQARAA